jgi:hypothetical protein
MKGTTTMRSTLRLLTLALPAVVLACAGCGSGSSVATDAAPHAAQGSTSGSTSTSTSTSSDPTATTSPTAGDQPSSDFCTEARRLGAMDAQGLSAGTADVKAELSRLDSLDAIAPAEIADDFRLFTRAEYTLLDPGSRKGLPQAQLDQQTTPAAFLRVEQYLQQSCGIS